MIKFGQIMEKNEKKGLVTVKFERPEACGSCTACGFGSQKGTVTLQSDRNVGEWVRVEMPEKRFLQATVLVYAVPLAGLVLGVFLGWALGGGSDLWTISGAFGGLALSLLALFAIDRRMSKKSEWIPKITAVYPEKPALDDLGCGIT